MFFYVDGYIRTKRNISLMFISTSLFWMNPTSYLMIRGHRLEENSRHLQPFYTFQAFSMGLHLHPAV